MDKLLIIVDMQNDFIDGSLANKDAQDIVPNIVDLIKRWNGDIVCTADTHYENYLLTQEGKNLPVKHCIAGTHGWQLNDSILKALSDRGKLFSIRQKTSFGNVFSEVDAFDNKYDEIYLCGTCTDICVINVAMRLKALYPEIPIKIYACMCAGLDKDSHRAALKVMNNCQMEIIYD